MFHSRDLTYLITAGSLVIVQRKQSYRSQRDQRAFPGLKHKSRFFQLSSQQKFISILITLEFGQESDNIEILINFIWSIRCYVPDYEIASKYVWMF